MSKLSGYDLTLTAFLPASPNDPESMVEAVRVLRGIIITLSEAGFREIEARPKYRARREVADPPLPLPVTAVEEGPDNQQKGDAGSEFSSSGDPHADERPGAEADAGGVLDMLPDLDRRKKA